MSVLTYISHAIDKANARAGWRRTPESTLLLLGIAGGWPGALVAQHLFRHKSKKASLQTAFRATLAIHCAALGALSLSSGNALLRTMIG